MQTQPDPERQTTRRELYQALEDTNQRYLRRELTRDEWAATMKTLSDQGKQVGLELAYRPWEADRTEPPAIVITQTGHNLWGVTRGGRAVAALRWHGEHMRLVNLEGEHLGDLFRSDGKHTADGITYTYRAYLPGPAGREVARRTSLDNAVAAILAG